jgi:hypothetical protein
LISSPAMNAMRVMARSLASWSSRAIERVMMVAM